MDRQVQERDFDMVVYDVEQGDAPDKDEIAEANQKQCPCHFDVPLHQRFPHFMSESKLCENLAMDSEIPKFTLFLSNKIRSSRRTSRSRSSSPRSRSRGGRIRCRRRRRSGRGFCLRRSVSGHIFQADNCTRMFPSSEKSILISRVF